MQLIKEFKGKYNISSPENVYKFCKEFVKEDREYFIVIGLGANNDILYREIVTIGILNSCLIHPREVFKKAIINSVNNILLVHNHPSGSLVPSEEDLKVTKQLKEAGEILGIKVLDHIIITESGFKSIISA